MGIAHDRLMRKLFAVLLFLAAATASAQSLYQLPDNLARPISFAPQILIPAAGSIAGANGTFFRSDIHVINFGSHSQRVRFQWLPRGVSSVGVGQDLEIDLPAASGFNSEDFVRTVLEESTLGSIVITGINADGTDDPTARLYATSRIWTPQPGTNGTTSQTLPVLSMTDVNSSQLWIFGIRRDERYRANVGIVNLSGTTQRYAITVVSSTPPGSTSVQDVEVNSLSMEQVTINGGAGALQLVINNITDGPRSSAWTAYASSVDNITGDSWSMVGFNSPSITP